MRTADTFQAVRHFWWADDSPHVLTAARTRHPPHTYPARALQPRPQRCHESPPHLQHWPGLGECGDGRVSSAQMTFPPLRGW